MWFEGIVEIGKLRAKIIECMTSVDISGEQMWQKKTIKNPELGDILFSKGEKGKDSMYIAFLPDLNPSYDRMFRFCETRIGKEIYLNPYNDKHDFRSYLSGFLQIGVFNNESYKIDSNKYAKIEYFISVNKNRVIIITKSPSSPQTDYGNININYIGMISRLNEDDENAFTNITSWNRSDKSATYYPQMFLNSQGRVVDYNIMHDVPYSDAIANVGSPLYNDKTNSYSYTKAFIFHKDEGVRGYLDGINSIMSRDNDNLPKWINEDSYLIFNEVYYKPEVYNGPFCYNGFNGLGTTKKIALMIEKR